MRTPLVLTFALVMASACSSPVRRSTPSDKRAAPAGATADSATTPKAEKTRSDREVKEYSTGHKHDGQGTEDLGSK